MKKLMIAASAALCATVGFSDVTSANVVGYYTTTLPARQMNMLGVNFQKVGGGDISVQDIIPDPLGQGCSGVTMKTLVANADQLCFWDTTIKGSYIYLYLSTSTAKRNKWCVYTAAASLTDKAKAFWGEHDTASIARLSPGMGFWFKRAKFTAEKTLQLSGQVTVAQEGLNIQINPGMNMFTYGYTIPFAPNPDLAKTGVAIDWLGKGCKGVTMKTLVANADQLCFWDTTIKGSYIYLYLNSSTARRNRWCVYTAAASLTEEAREFWGEHDTPTAAVVPDGVGCWYKRAGNTGFTLTLDQPYSL